MKKTWASLLVARVLMERPEAEHYGYDVAARTGLQTGSAHPILKRWADQGLLSSAMEEYSTILEARPARRLFSLTEQGRAALTELLDSARQSNAWSPVFEADLSFKSPYVSGSQVGVKRNRPTWC